MNTDCSIRGKKIHFPNTLRKRIRIRPFTETYNRLHLYLQTQVIATHITKIDIFIVSIINQAEFRIITASRTNILIHFAVLDWQIRDGRFCKTVIESHVHESHRSITASYFTKRMTDFWILNIDIRRSATLKTNIIPKNRIPRKNFGSTTWRLTYVISFCFHNNSFEVVCIYNLIFIIPCINDIYSTTILEQNQSEYGSDNRYRHAGYPPRDCFLFHFIYEKKEESTVRRSRSRLVWRLTESFCATKISITCPSC